MQPMKLLVFTAVAMFSITPTVFAASPPPYCLIVTDRCDRFELRDIGGGLVEGQWLNYDCAGSSAFVSGQILPEGPRLVCGEFGPESCPVDSEYPTAVVVKTQDGDAGALDFYQMYAGGWSLYRSDLAYTRIRDTCSVVSQR